jgi:hypothetical protein
LALKKASPVREAFLFEGILLSSGVVLAETVAAVNRTIAARAEGNLGILAAGGTDCRVHFPGGAIAAEATGLLAGCPALGAASGFVGESFLSEKVLFRSGEHEIGAALAAGQVFVLCHFASLLKSITQK